MRVAFIHDWLIGMRGGEKCLETLLELYPESDVYTLFYEPDAMPPSIRSKSVTESLLGFGRKWHRFLLPFYGFGVWDLQRKLAKNHRDTPYDLVISISHCAAKNVRAPGVGDSRVKHLCYCLTPPRYLWDQFSRYIENPVMRVVGEAARRILQTWDLRGAKAPDEWIAISEFVRDRLRRVYGVDASVIYPPVETEFYRKQARQPGTNQFLVVNALVPYKNTHLIVEAFRELEHELVIVGSGPEESRLRALAGKNVHFVGRVGQEQLRELYESSLALVFAAEEDFGIAPVEMQAAGNPVIAYGSGGSLETVSPETGVFFSELSSGAIKAAVSEFLATRRRFSSETCRAHAERFSVARFAREFHGALGTVRRSVNGSAVNA